jgi:hypothetical protein
MTMKAENSRPTLNRVLFAGQPLDSGALAPLSTLLHRFTEAGDYEMFIRRDGYITHRSPVRVVGELPEASGKPDGDMRAMKSREGAPYQANIDLATYGQIYDECAPDKALTLANGGILGFYVGGGSSRYTVALTRIGAEKVTVLDSAAGVPEGDFFAVTFVRPGVYSVANRLGEGRAKVEVRLPTEKGYRPNDGVHVHVSREGFDPAGVSLLSGQSVLFQCRTPAQFTVELVEPAPETIRKEGEQRRHTVRKRRAGPKP